MLKRREGEQFSSLVYYGARDVESCFLWCGRMREQCLRDAMMKNDFFVEVIRGLI